MSRSRVQREDFDIAAEIDAITASRADIGAVATFTGLVRDHGGTVAAMELEHYPGMTERALKEIAQEAERRFPLLDACIIHRYGLLNPGDRIVLTIAASAHRQAAFDGAAFLMDYLKTKAPFWKRETTPEGGAEWVDARDSDDAATAKWSNYNG
ncbi:MAG: molybdenum cofactor biosynthesis protein MoaE [Rhodobacteraceae bacterium]|nr:molybdenum cofactor biosynthesis protein MoaE [Paracoccaceae bacterium]